MLKRKALDELQCRGRELRAKHEMAVSGQCFASSTPEVNSRLTIAFTAGFCPREHQN